MAPPRFAQEERLDRQARAKRRFNQANSLDANNTVAAPFARKRGSESLEPTVFTARNGRSVSLDALSRG